MAADHASTNEVVNKIPNVVDFDHDFEKITVYLINGLPKVWNAKDVLALRSHCRIVGVLVGCLPRSARQNVQLGLPLQLMPEELTLLLKKGLVELRKEDITSEEQNTERIKLVEEERKTVFEAQQKLYLRDRQEEMRKQMTRIVEGKRAKRQRQQQARGDDPAQHGGEGEEEVETEEEVCLAKLPITATPEKHMLQQLFTENPWKRETENAESDWTFPATEEEKLRSAVFQDLWEKRYYLTSGQKFGGDFLAYPGDPSRFHSFYIVMCLKYTQQLPSLDLISMGRLGANVRKTVLLASLDKDSQVRYTSLQWTGMS